MYILAKGDSVLQSKQHTKENIKSRTVGRRQPYTGCQFSDFSGRRKRQVKIAHFNLLLPIRTDIEASGNEED